MAMMAPLRLSSAVAAHLPRSGSPLPFSFPTAAVTVVSSSSAGGRLDKKSESPPPLDSSGSEPLASPSPICLVLGRNCRRLIYGSLHSAATAAKAAACRQ